MTLRAVRGERTGDTRATRTPRRSPLSPSAAASWCAPSIADVAGLVDLDAVGQALTDAAVAALDGGLRAAIAAVERRPGEPLPTRMLLVAMGRLGGAELGYGSDADVLFVHDPLPGADGTVPTCTRADQAALAVAGELRRLLGSPGPEPALAVDADLRPGGPQRTAGAHAGLLRRVLRPMVAQPWEAQALTRAMPVVGDAELGRRFEALVDPVRWPARGLTDGAVREIRRIKARVEAERLPRGADPHRHLKLGRGGLSDVEWTVQLLQLRHAGTRAGSSGRRQRSRALHAARDAGLVDPDDAAVLELAWRLASRVRNAVVLFRGRPSDSLPTSARELDGVARLVGYPPGGGRDVRRRLPADHAPGTQRRRPHLLRLTVPPIGRSDPGRRPHSSQSLSMDVPVSSPSVSRP